MMGTHDAFLSCQSNVSFLRSGACVQTCRSSLHVESMMQNYRRRLRRRCFHGRFTMHGTAALRVTRSFKSSRSARQLQRV